MNLLRPSLDGLRRSGIFRRRRIRLWRRTLGFTIPKKKIGASGFEPETFCTPSKRATSLRYAPMDMQVKAWKRKCQIQLLIQNGIYLLMRD